MAVTEWTHLSVSDTAKILRTDPSRGLAPSRANALLRKVGYNQLATRRPPGAWQVFLSQFGDFMVIVLLVATIISAALGEVMDAVAILAIVIVNALLGMFQEQRAEKSLAALRELSAPSARAIRGGQTVQLRARELAPGDLVVLEAGDRVPADLRITEAVGLEIEESAFTGESVPVVKAATTLAGHNLALADRHNMAFMGTIITRGRGRGLVVGTGASTEIGRIATLIQEAGQEMTPLQRRLEELGRWIVALCGAICAGVFVLGIWQGRPVTAMFLSSVSLAVAAIPEGLPAVVTVALSIGVQRMSRRRAIVRRLPAVETLGCTTVICSDKTGTLTRNEMTACEVLAGVTLFVVTGVGYRPEGDIRPVSGEAGRAAMSDLDQVLRIGCLCNNAELVEGAGRRSPGPLDRGKKAGGDWNVHGDPTEGALLTLAHKAGIAPTTARSGLLLAGELPFEPQRKMMTVIFVNPAAPPDHRETAYVKGALDVVLDRCVAMRLDGRVEPLDSTKRREIISAGDRMAARALRVLAMAYRPSHAGELSRLLPEGSDKNYRAVESGLIFAGLVGMVDPPRPEAVKAIETAKRAGIRTVMITGDHRRTAEAIASALGLSGAGGTARSMTGSDIDGLDDKQLAEAAEHISVFARVSPEHKIRLVRALKSRGEIVAMTGDGVNDAPAIKEADIGVAMGQAGTDVAKEAAAMVLADDNYATIVSAVEEGRGIYDNIRRFVRYLLTCNVGEVLTMALAVALRLPLPLLAIQILWMNLVTDGIPAVALGLEPPEPDTMKRGPRSPREGIFAGGLGGRILWTGTIIGATGLAVFTVALSFGRPLEVARTMAFCTLVFAQMVYVLRCRREGNIGLAVPLSGNPLLLVAVGVSVAMQVATVYLPPLADLLRTARLSGVEWLMVGATAFYGTLLGDSLWALRTPRRRAANPQPSL